MKRIEFGEIKIGDTATKHIQDCLDTDWISMGPKVAKLEKDFAALMGSKYGVAVSSGTTAITAITLALPEIAKKPVTRGKSKVICPALGFIANSTGIVSGGLVPKWVDIKPDTLNINESLIEEAIDDDVVAIYAIGTMGRPSELRVLKEIADRHNLILFEDGCENYGSKLHGEFSHKYCIAGCSSLFQAHLVQAGEGSVIFTDDEQLRDILISIRSHGRCGSDPYFNHIRFGSNFKMTDLCASVGLEGVEQFYENITARKLIWNELVDFTQSYHDLAWFSSDEPYMEVMPHGFSITCKKDGLINKLKDKFDLYNIHYKRNFGCVPTQHNVFDTQHKLGDFPQAEWVGDNGIHIGCHRYMSRNDIDRICVALEEAFE